MSHSMIRAAMLSLVVSGSVVSLAPGAALADSMKECSVKYQAAKKNGTLNGADWKSFRATQCGGSATPMAKTDTATNNGAAGAGRDAPSPATVATTAAPIAAGAAAPAATTKPDAGKTAQTVAPSGGPAVFPSAVNPKYASLSAGKARMKTCVDQYKANKADNGNGGLKWIQKGGGYYSECSKKLKAG